MHLMARLTYYNLLKKQAEIQEIFAKSSKLEYRIIEWAEIIKKNENVLLLQGIIL